MNKLTLNIMIAMLLIVLGYLGGSSITSNRYKLKMANIDKQTTAKYEAIRDEYLIAERKLNSEISKIDTKLYEEKENAKVTIDRLKRDVNNGTLRLSVATSAHSACSTTGNAALASKFSEETRTELLPKTSIDILTVGQDADNEVRDKNAVIDLYNEVRQQNINLREQLAKSVKD